MTWGRKNGDAGNCAVWPPVCTYSGMDSLLRLRYIMMADMNDAIVSPVGAVWRNVRNNFPGINLYSPDESHPSVAGTYAAACSFYTAIFRKDPTLITYDHTLNATDAANIRLAAKEVVFDSLEHWFIGTYDLTSEYSYLNTGGGLTYQFTNLSQNATSQLWDFGFMTDTSSNLMMNFPVPGTFNVQLTTYNNCDTVTSVQTITVTTTEIEEPGSKNGFNLHPNPATDLVRIINSNGSEHMVRIFDTRGRKIFENILPGSSTIDVSSFKKGAYIVSSESGETKRYHYLILK